MLSIISVMVCICVCVICVIPEECQAVLFNSSTSLSIEFSAVSSVSSVVDGADPAPAALAAASPVPCPPLPFIGPELSLVNIRNVTDNNNITTKTVTVRCSPGYYPSSFSPFNIGIGVCSLDGTWLFSPQLVCETPRCSPLVLQKHVIIISNQSNININININNATAGDTLQLGCQQNGNGIPMKMIGSNITTCTPQGTWTNQQTTCVVVCDPLDMLPVRGRLVVNNSNVLVPVSVSVPVSVNTTITVACDDSSAVFASMNGSSDIYTCMEDITETGKPFGRWNQDRGRCVNQCDRTALPPTDASDATRSWYIYSAPADVLISSSLSLGQQLPTSPSTLTMSGLSVYAECLYPSGNGKYETGARQWTCDDNGKWDNSTCTAVCYLDVSKLSNILPLSTGYISHLSGQKNFPFVFVNRTINLTCAEGNKMDDAGLLTCLINGQWDKDIPTCQQNSSTGPISPTGTGTGTSTSDSSSGSTSAGSGSGSGSGSSSHNNFTTSQDTGVAIASSTPFTSTTSFLILIICIIIVCCIIFIIIPSYFVWRQRKKSSNLQHQMEKEQERTPEEEEEQEEQEEGRSAVQLVPVIPRHVNPMSEPIPHPISPHAHVVNNPNDVMIEFPAIPGGIPHIHGTNDTRDHHSAEAILSNETGIMPVLALGRISLDHYVIPCNTNSDDDDENENENENENDHPSSTDSDSDSDSDGDGDTTPGDKLNKLQPVG